MSTIALILFFTTLTSYELFTKHLIREIAEEGHLQLVIPIGRDVEKAITRDRLEKAVSVPGKKNNARVVDAFPAVSASNFVLEPEFVSVFFLCVFPPTCNHIA